uniref:Unclassified n=5 Tax=Fusarium sambucinum species complex TaxID=569360 RepID=W1I9R1_FUSPS|nr:unclassified [Fusarium pseudograminearum CS3220]CDL73159.1 unclassified [Fusarium pseudograminearum CS3427]CDL73247.1 unclassified [Fusarium pseudograminearum CS3487]CDL73337.1 unclassified [Fusarium pseudograminearum CS5834]CDX48275.1 unclassified [Fusarium pseudograminearum CS5834]
MLSDLSHVVSEDPTHNEAEKKINRAALPSLLRLRLSRRSGDTPIFFYRLLFWFPADSSLFHPLRFSPVLVPKGIRSFQHIVKFIIFYYYYYLSMILELSKHLSILLLLFSFYSYYFELTLSFLILHPLNGL